MTYQLLKTFSSAMLRIPTCFLKLLLFVGYCSDIFHTLQFLHDQMETRFACSRAQPLPLINMTQREIFGFLVAIYIYVNRYKIWHGIRAKTAVM